MNMLTGGTRDVNPQYLSAIVTESAANTFTEVTIPLPVLRGNFGGQRKYQVLELLKVIWSMSTGDGATASQRLAQLTTSSQSASIDFDNPDLVTRFRDNIVITTSGLFHHIGPVIQDFTDNAGHGLIIATSDLFVGVVGTSQTNAIAAAVRIIYRFKNIGVDEFVGLAIQQG